MKRRAGLLLLALAYLGFVAIGLPDGLLGVASPSMRAHFAIAPDALGPLLASFAAGYLLSSFASGWVLARMSVGALLAASCAATGLALLGYAVAPAWWVVVALGLPAGLGAGAIDAGLNTYVATNHGPRTLNWIHACYGVGTSTGPMIMTAVLTAGRPWQRGYAFVGAAQLALAAAFAATLRRWPRPGASGSGGAGVAARETLRLPAAWLGIAAFALYTGLEAIAGVWAYSLLTESRGVPMVTAGTWVSLYWASLTAGRVVAGFVANRVPVHRLLRSCMAGALVGSLLIAFDPLPGACLAGLALSGFAFAPIFPTLIAATPARLGGQHAANAIGFQVAGAVTGQSMLPWAVGLGASRLGLEIVGPAMIVAALVLLVVYEALEASAPAVPETAIPGDVERLRSHG